MANSPKKNQPPKGGEGGCFFGCLGFPYPNYDVDDPILNENSKQSLDDFINEVPNKRMKWFIWARKKRRSATKTVPLDAAAMAEKPRRSWSCKDVNVMVSKRDNNKKEKNISQPLVDHVMSPEKKSPAAQKTNRTRGNVDKHIILGNKKSSLKTMSSDPIEKATCLENPLPPDRKITTSTITTNNVFVHSISLPVVYSKGRKLTTTNSGEDTPIIATKKSKNTVVVRRVDSIIGMSIILVMLLIMLMWGKVCAILCTSAWFYFVPRFRVKKGLSKASKMDSSSSIVEQIDINSQEYKKKVVLKGLLDRNKNRKKLLSPTPNN